MAKRVLFVADSDSNLAFAAAFGAHLTDCGMTSEVALVADGAALLVQAGNAIGHAGAGIRVAASLDALLADAALLDYDVVFPLITGRLIEGFCVALNLLALSEGAAKPVTVGGFIGEWISGEAQVEQRGALDVFVVNREDELALFSRICARGGHDGRLVALPYGFLVRHGFATPLARGFDYDLTTEILFADQVQAPRSDAERLSLYEGLEALAKASPERKIRFCTREAAGGVTSHRAKGDITDHFSPERLGRVPNLVVERGTLRRRLPAAKLVLSVSSTAGVEALVNGIPALFLRGFSESGAEKFESSGLLVDLVELRRPKTFAPASAFYAAASRTDVWDAFAALVRTLPERDAARGAPVVARSSGVPGSPAAALEELLWRTPGVSGVQALPAALGVRPLDLATSLTALRPAPPEYAARIVVSDAPRTAPADPPPTVVATTLSGYAAYADLSLQAGHIAVHIPVRFAAGDELGVSLGDAGHVLGRHDGDVFTLSAPDGVAASLATYPTTSGAVSVIRLVSDVDIELRSAALSRTDGLLPPAWIACEPRTAFTRLGMLSLTVTGERTGISTRGASGQVVVLRLMRDAVERARPLVTFDDAEGANLTVHASADGALTLEFSAGGETLRVAAPDLAADATLAVISAPLKTVVVVNSWRHAFEAAFRPTGVRIDAEPGLAAPLCAVFGARFSDDAANAIAQALVERRETAVVPTAAAATAETARVLGPYLDLVGAEDLAAAMAVVDGLRSPLAYAERHLRAAEHARAFAISALCADRTPTSKAHLLICAEALAALGAPDRAEPFLRRAEQLAPRDPRVKATARLVRRRTRGLLGVLAVFRHLARRT